MGPFTECGGGEERCSSDGDHNIDIDVALSYIDERLQDVLGHYQKDFEGGVSAENLGAKFGGYGSFLPTYQRSPMRPHQRNPQKVQIQNISKPINFPSKGAHRSSAGISSGFIHASVTPPLPVSRTSSVDSSIKFQTLEECAPKRECMNLENSRSDQKGLKLWIRVGSDNIRSQKNAAIYSGLGLVMSPSPSLEDSPSECEGNFPEPQETQDESPSSIIKIMTCFPVPDGVLLSPLDDGVTCLMEEEGFMNIHHVEESSSPLANKFANIRGDGEVFRYNEIQQSGKNVRMTELADESYEDPTNTHPKKADAEPLTSDSLKALSASKRIDKLNGTKEGPAKASEINKSVVNGSSNFEKKNALESASIVEAGKIDKWNAKTSLVERVWKDKKAGCIITNSGGPKGESGCDVFKETFDIPEAKSDIPEGKKDLDSRACGLARKKLDLKANSPLQDGIIIPLGKKRPSSCCKMKSNGSKRRGTSALELTIGSLRVGSSTAPEAMTTHQKNVPNRSKRDDIEAVKDVMKVKESQDRLVGKEKLEKEDIRMDYLGSPVKERADASNSIKETCAPRDKLKERLGGKKSSCPSTLEAHQEATKICALAGNRSISAVTPIEVAPVVIQENWVGCDKCHKWRLLPYGENPDHLPRKWQCSMLDWLPGMNRCSVSEEETTNALNALYQVPVPVPEVQTVQAVHTQGAGSVETLADAKYLGKNHKHRGLDVASSGGKGRHDISKSVRHSSLINLAHFSRDQPAVPKRVLTAEEKTGDAKILKMKYKREADQDGFRVSKKVKTTNMNYIDVDQSLDRLEPELDSQKYNEYPSFRDSKGVTKKLMNQVNKDVTTDDQNKRYAAGKKKKLDWQDSLLSLEAAPSNGHQAEEKWIVEKQNSVSEQGKGKKLRKSELQRKESSASIPDDRLNRIGKVSRIRLSSSRDDPADGNSSYEGKRTEKDPPLAQHCGNSVSRQAIGCKNSSNRDLSFGQLPMAANSSSSKISSSSKVKVNSQEVRGSPVESVSSSPLRTLHMENFKIKPLGKDAAAAAAADFSLMNNPRRCLEAEADNENNQLGRARKEKPFSSNDQRSMKSLSFDHQDRAIDHKIRGKVKVCNAHPSKLPITHLTNGYIENHGQDNQYPYELSNKEHCHEKERVSNLHFHKGSVPEKLGKLSSSRAKEKHSTSESGLGRGRIRASNSHEEQNDLFLSKSVKYETDNEINDSAPHKEEMSNMKFKIERGCSIKSDKAEKNGAGKKFSAVKRTSESCKIEKQTKFEEHDHPPGKPNAICQKDGGSIVQQNHKVEKSLKCLSSDSTEQVEIASGKSDAAKATSQHGEYEGLYGINVGSRDPTPNRHGAKDIGATDLVKKGSSIRAARNALKEAKNLKHLADRLKISGSGFESTELFFQAALKFLHGATLVELCNSEGVSCREMSSVELFSSTAKLCEYCANEFEKGERMAFAALSYKCMEVAYMQVVYSTDSIASRDRSELQRALEMAPPVESPSSSVSGVYNLNNQVAVDKMDIAKDAGSQVIGNHVIAARNRPNFVRLLDFAQIVGFAMDASSKSQNAVAAANLLLAEVGNKEGISSLKRVLDFSFHDVDGFLHLVRLAMEALTS